MGRGLAPAFRQQQHVFRGRAPPRFAQPEPWRRLAPGSNPARKGTAQVVAHTRSRLADRNVSRFFCESSVQGDADKSR